MCRVQCCVKAAWDGVAPVTPCVPQPLRPASGVRSVWFCGTRSSSPSLSRGGCFQTPKGSARAVRSSWPCGCCPAQPVLSTPLTKWLLDVCVQKDWVARRARSGQGILGVHGAILAAPWACGSPGVQGRHCIASEREPEAHKCSCACGAARLCLQVSPPNNG